MAPTRMLYPLEGDAYDEVRFKVYDKAGRRIWGELRVRREKNPDLLTLEARQDGPNDWKPVIKLTAHEGKLLQATFGLKSGFNHPIPEGGKET